MIPFMAPMMMGRQAPLQPTIASFSQSSNFGGPGAQVASLTNMSDGLAEPFVATNTSALEFLRATLAASALVTSVTLGATTSTGGWGATYINGAVLERSNDNGATWTAVQTLSGFSTSASASALNKQTIAVGAMCTDLRARQANNYLAVSEFTVA